jgi:hypothetical protein
MRRQSEENVNPSLTPKDILCFLPFLLLIAVFIISLVGMSYASREERTRLERERLKTFRRYLDYQEALRSARTTDLPDLAFDDAMPPHEIEQDDLPPNVIPIRLSRRQDP